MLDALYIGATGLTEFARGLNTISNNVANLNTPGFKRSELAFTDLFYRYELAGQGQRSLQQGAGVSADKATTVFLQGELRATGNDDDLAIDGLGLFVLRNGAQTAYTRAGQFHFDEDGYLVSQDGQSRVAGLAAGGSLTDISLGGKRADPPKATTQVILGDSLSANDTGYDLGDVSVIDRLGASHTLTLHFDNDAATAPGTWRVSVSENGITLAQGVIGYGDDGLARAGKNTLTMKYAPGNGAAAQSITFDFSGSTLFSSAASSLKLQSQNGYAAGALLGSTFDEQGRLTFRYSNGQSRTGDRLALAWFADMQALHHDGGNVLRAPAEAVRLLGGAGDQLFGAVKRGNLEMSNVDLAQQFSELIITQRGYQAASQIVSASNDMMQQIIDVKSKR